MTLGALALGIGMLVDNAIVVIENIERHLELGENPKEAAVNGTKEVALAITASTVTTIAVFVPVIFISGLIGQIFVEFALTISFSLIASLFVALTVVPIFGKPLLTYKAFECSKEASRIMAVPKLYENTKMGLNETSPYFINYHRLSWYIRIYGI